MSAAIYGDGCCVATVVSNNFLRGAMVMLASFQRHNEHYRGEFVVLWNSTYAPLSKESKAALRSVCAKVSFYEVDDRGYGDVFEFAENVAMTPKRLRPAFMILDVFKLKQYRRVVALDSDMLLLGNLWFLFTVECEFAVIRAYEQADKPLAYFNTGTMVISGDCLAPHFFQGLTRGLSTAQVDRKKGKADQAVLNLFFAERDKRYLDIRYNFSKRLVPDGTPDPVTALQTRDVRILHFVGQKPWDKNKSENEQCYNAVERLWHDCNAELN